MSPYIKFIRNSHSHPYCILWHCIASVHQFMIPFIDIYCSTLKRGMALAFPIKFTCLLQRLSHVGGVRMTHRPCLSQVRGQQCLTWRWLHSKLLLVLHYLRSLHRSTQQCHRMPSWSHPMLCFFWKPSKSCCRASLDGIVKRGRKCWTGHFQSWMVPPWTWLCRVLLCGAGPSGYTCFNHGNLLEWLCNSMF